MTNKQIVALIKQMTLEEKAALCSGDDTWTTKPNPKRGIPRLRMADGPHGLRLEDRKHAKENGGPSVPATCFPPAVTLACSWNPSLAKQVGSALAEECAANNVGMLLGPGVNIKRSPLCGRNFEYFSEDPLLAGKMAAGLIQGLEEKGIASSVKHFAVNNQEHKRMSISAAVDERALFDLYLKPFEIAIKEGKPSTIMCSYNRVNGTYASQHRRLLTDILRLQFGFDGVVVSDWGAVYQRAKGIAAGLDLEMPSSGGVNDYAIVQAVRNGSLSENSLDVACWNLLRLIFSHAEKTATKLPACDYSANHQLAVKAASQSAVLLKNNDTLLPFSKQTNIAVIGEMAENPRYQGSGSSVINPKQLVDFVTALEDNELSFSYTPGYLLDGTTAPALLHEAARIAESADAVVLFVGLPDAYESEGFDREHLSLPAGHIQLLETVCSANKNVCVVLCAGAPVEMPWIDKVQAVLCPYLGGEGVGEALVQLLYGDNNPGGKVAESWPLALEDTPSFHHFPMGPTEVTYSESIFVGYRYYDTANRPVLFPFGYGLSYTSFAYSNSKLIGSNFAKGEDITVQFSVQNTGSIAGDEIAQVYLARTQSAYYQPAHELKAFQRIHLLPGETKEIQLTIPYRELGFYDVTRNSHVVETGEYEIQVGSNCQNLPLKIKFEVEGVTLSPPKAFSKNGNYGTINKNDFPLAHFKEIYKRTLVGNAPTQRGHYTAITTLGELQDSPTGRFLLTISKMIGKKAIRFSQDPAANARAVQGLTEDLPFKNITMQTWGIVSPAASAALLRMCNGQRGLLRFTRELVRRKPYKRRKSKL